MPHTSPALLISLSGVARLAQVKRPVVSVWRSRSLGTAQPFPAALANAGGPEQFDAHEVAEWLLATGRGNNADPVGDAAAHAVFEGALPSDAASFDALSSLVAMRAASGAPIAGLNSDELADLADGIDPDDVMLLSEIEALEEAGPPLARFVDALVDGAYDVSAAFESLLSERARGRGQQLGAPSLSSAAVSLVAGAGLELACGIPGSDPVRPRFSDPIGDNADVLTALARSAPEHIELDVTIASDSAVARFARRRLRAHGLVARTAAPSGPLVLLAHFGGGDRAVGGAVGKAATLEVIERIAEGMSDTQRAVIVAPASLLCDGGLDAAASAVRSEILRLGRVRAIVRLPPGLIAAHPRQALALWALGPAHESIPIAERWTMLANLSEHGLDDATRLDLIGDLSAAMGDRRTVSAHSFRFAKLAYTSSLLARAGSYFDPTTAVKYGHTDAAPNAELAARLDATVAQLGVDSPLRGADITLSEQPELLESSVLGALAREGHVRCLSGTRLSPAHLSTGAGFRVIGPEDIATNQLPHTIAHPPSARTVDRFLLAASYPAARLTEPGDVVFVTSPATRAVVDRVGSAVVSYPARILRINAVDPAGLVPEVLAADLAALTGRDWRATLARRVLRPERPGLAQVLADIQSAQDAARQRLAQLEELGALVIAGVTSGTVSLNPTPKGTT